MTAGRFEHLHTLARLWRHPARPRAEIDEFRDRKLRALVAHAATHVPFYREKLGAAGVGPADVASTTDLARLPLTTKAERRVRPVGDLLAEGVDPRPLVSRYTAGSTGEPARVMRTRLEDVVLNQFRWRARAALGMRVLDRTAYVVSPGVPTDRVSERNRLRSLGAMAGIYRGFDVDCLRAPEEIARDLVRLRPDVIAGYASSLVDAIEDWRRLGGEAHPPRLVVCGGDAMSPALRARLHAGFGAPVRQTYGCHELNLVGWECTETGDLHLCDDLAIVEVLHEGRPVLPGEIGDVVVTNLHAYAWPYLRYELGDRAVAGDPLCRCGAPFATLRSIQGRTMDALVLADGRVMHHWELLPMTFWEMPWHRQYQVVQESVDRFVLRVVADAEPPAADLEQLYDAVRAKLGPGPIFTVECIDEIERAASGKSRVCVSRVAREDRPPRKIGPP